MLGKLWKWLVDFVYPKDCAGCGRLGEWLCSQCKGEFEIAVQICPMCGKESVDGYVHKMCTKRLGMDGLTIVYSGDEWVIGRVFFKVKFEFNRELLEEFVELFDFKVGKKFDMVVPVPLSVYRRNWRGFNQSQIIANEVGKQLGVVVVDVVRQVKKNKEQGKIKSRRDKVKNVKGVFEINKDIDVKGRYVLLVDDVFDSGATMREVSKILKRAGVGFVWGLAIVGLRE